MTMQMTCLAEGETVRFYVPRVRDLMTSEPKTLSVDDSLLTARDLFASAGIRHLPVVDSTGALVGLLTHRDFTSIAFSRLASLDPEAQEEIYRALRIGDVMTRNVRSVSPSMPLTDAASVMLAHKYGCLPVVDQGRLAGILTESDFVAEYDQRRGS